ncbi:MAG TPA: DNA repair protein RadA [Candidatus Obscuribacterales bacterium]
MAKPKSRWVCQQCGFASSKFLGRCTECLAWNSLAEEALPDEAAAALSRGAAPARRGLSATLAGDGPRPLDSVELGEWGRFPTGIAGLDEVLGGGLVPGSVILLAGDPGVGKSTLLLRMCELVAGSRPVLYISGEESAGQVKLRAQRLGIQEPGILVDAEQDVLAVRERLLERRAQLVVVDSIQSVFHPELTSAPGSVSQVRESAAVLVGAAKALDITTILVGHVTKDGSIAGPRVLEHMVDVVLQFEGEPGRQLRVLRAAKNRFGSTQEVAIFAMGDKGLVEVDNPSALFLADRLGRLDLKQAPSGTAVIVGGQGARSLLLEVQALVGASPYPSPRRAAIGWDYNRLLQILAVLEKKVGLSLSRFDVYVNIVGGFELGDPAGDLGVSLAVATSSLDRSVDPALVCIGEIGLTGEIRPVVALERRLKEAARMGFRRAIVPAGNLPVVGLPDQMEIRGVEFLVEALEAAMPGQTFRRRQDAPPPPVPEAPIKTAGWVSEPDWS